MLASRSNAKDWAPRLPLQLLAENRPPNKLPVGLTPLKALETVKSDCVTAEQRQYFLANARKDALLGATAKSQKSVRSGVRCWMSFVGPSAKQPPCWASPCAGFRSDSYDPIMKRYFPPPIQLLVPWTILFRSPHTLKNYLGYVRTGCILAGKPVEV